MIFQEPMTSLDPHYRIERQIAGPLIYHRGLSRRSARPRVLELLELVGIPDPAARLRAYPHELSGGPACGPIPTSSPAASVSGS
jgi:oligopeptide transport system ATP-binding protein